MVLFDRCLNVTYIKRDEGFESDGSDNSDSAAAAAAAALAIANSGSEEKIIKDHAVFVRDEMIQSHTYFPWLFAFPHLMMWIALQ